MTHLPARTGWEWLKQGGRLFRQQPAALTTLLFANILFSIGLSAVPFLGPLLTFVLIPSFSMAFMQACLMIENGTRVTPAVLLTGFRQPALMSLCKVGLVYLAVFLLLIVIAQFALDPEFLRQMKPPIDPANPPKVSASSLLSMFGVFVLEAAALVVLCYTAPLVYWKNMGPGKATFYSFFAVVRAARVFFVMLTTWFSLFFGTCLVTVFVLGGSVVARIVIMWMFFLAMLLLQCALYVGYREIFGKPVDTAVKP